MELENIKETYEEHKKAIIVILKLLAAIIFFVVSDTASNALGYVVKSIKLS